MYIMFMITSKRVVGGGKKKTHRKIPPILPVLLGIVILGLVISTLIQGHDVALFNPKGLVANEQHQLMVISTLIMLGFGLPVILALYFMMWKYREDNGKVTHIAETKNSKPLLLFAWGGPLITVIILASLMIPATQHLQPQSSIKADNKQMIIDVVALRWKWLFIYPEQNIASVNFVQIPVNTPVQFELTADDMPMSSFWIPKLAGMLYTMTGHINPLNLMADTIGDYEGKTAEINGPGYAGMKFTTRVSTQENFDSWVAQKQRTFPSLTQAEYQKLLTPSENNKPAFYSSPNPDLFNSIISKYKHGMDGMDMGSM